MKPTPVVRYAFFITIQLFVYTVHVTGENAIQLIDEPKCQKINKWCKDLDDNSDLSVLECLQSVKSSEITILKRECQQVIANHTENIIENNNVRKRLHKSCGDELEKFGCDKNTGKNAYFACVLDNREDIRSVECLKDIQRLEAVAFFDVRWVTQFLQVCNHDLEVQGCDTETNGELLFTGKSLLCLQNKIKSLDPKCKKQVLKLTEIQADNIRLDPELYFSCAADRLRFCRDQQPGTGLVFKCLMQYRTDNKMSSKCKEQLLKRENLVVQDFKISKGLMRACRDDIRKSHCRKQISDDKTIRLAQILLCLESYVRNGTKVSSNCEGEMIDQRKILMEDYRLSPEIVDGCKKDIIDLCETVVTGRTIHCLMEHVSPRNRDRRISDVCQRALETLIKETDAGEDWRVDPVLQEACQPVVRRACYGIRGGEARVMSCLMDNLGTDYMTEACENALVQIQYFIARDFNLDPLLYRSCREDAVTKCGARNNWPPDNYNTPNNGPLILPCLYRYAYHENSNLRLKPICFEQIRRVMRQRALSVELQPEIEDRCIEDLSLYCFDKNAKGEEIKCLQNHLNDLKEPCRLAVANFTEEQAQHVELNPVIMMHCRVFIDRHCKERRDEGDVMECLIIHKNDPDVKSDNKCRAAVEHFQLISLKNYHFTYKFKLACKPYVMRYCQGLRTKSDVVACLSEIIRNDTLNGIRNRILKECRQQVRSQLYQQRENINFDVKLKEACQRDIEVYCKNVDAGSAQILECLKTQPTQKLTDRCQKQMFKIHAQDMIDNSVDYTLVTMCQDMIRQFCETTDTAHVLDCLKHYMEEPNFDKKCKHVVIHRLIEQSKDYRFNPRLREACNEEINKFCSHILKDQKDQELEGKVTECLKKQFRKSNLNSRCEAEMSEILREQALNYNLNPLLKNMCSVELETICKIKVEDTSGQTEECLKNAFLKRTPMSAACQREVAMLIEDAQADIHVDPLLQKACTVDLLRYCGDVPQGGGKQLSCLEVTMSELQKPLQPECKNMLTKRIEMFKNAAIFKDTPPADVQALYAQVAASPARRYFMILAITCIGVIFFMGLFCGRVTRRSRGFKNK